MLTVMCHDALKIFKQETNHFVSLWTTTRFPKKNEVTRTINLIHYSQDLIPPLPNNQSLHVHVETYIFEVSRIDDKALTMTFELYMDFMWEETRIIINNKSSGWGHAGHFMASTNFLSEMWLPDIQV